MAVPESAFASHSSAPLYEPELWNSKVSAPDYMRVLVAHSAVVERLNSAVRPTVDSQADVAQFPVERTKEAIGHFNKFIEANVSDSDIAAALNIDKKDVEAFRTLAGQIYRDAGYQEHSNCYSYAMNDRDRYNFGGASPGERGAFRPQHEGGADELFVAQDKNDFQGYKQAIIHGLEADGALFAGQQAEPLEGHYRIAVFARDKAPDGVVLNDDPGFDMHFVREDQHGWSHKPGALPVTQLDNSGQPITDPRTANIGYDFMGFAYVPEGGLDVGKSALEPKSKPKSVDIPLEVRQQYEYRRPELNPFPD